MIFTVNKAPATIFCLFLALSAFLCSARDTITRKNPISANEKETLVSAERIFELGFFTPDVASDNRTYLGIWYYNLNARTVVWVANRDRPLLGSPGSLEIDENGNLRVSNATTNLWSISLASSSTSRTLKLTDSGNLVLSNDDQPENSLWESFNHPTDTFLPGMKMEGSLPLTSWIHEGDPRRGKFEFSLSQGERNIYVISRDINGTCRIPDRPDRIKDVPSYISELLLNFNSSSKSGSRLVMNYTGRVEYLNLNIDYWNLMWWGPGKCSIANKCGNFSSCNASNRIECKCLPRFKPSNSKNWNSGLFSDGCTRNSTCLPNDTFLTLKMMVVGKPNSKILVENEGECSVYCRTDCQCEAYSYVVATSKQGSNNNRCWIWTEPVSDLQEDYENSGQNLFVRVANSEIGDLQKGSTGNALHSLNLMLPLIIVFILACAITSTYLWRKKRANRQGHKRSGKRNRALRSLDSERHVKELIGSVGFQEEDGESIDVPFFEMESILAATDNFSNENKLGQGGYGLVYKTWRLWTENKVLDLVDPALHEVCNAEQFVKFVNVGLLCVQEDPNDRPTMSNVCHHA